MTIEKPTESLLKLNLGCGKDVREGWINIDAVAREGVLVGDIRCLEQFIGKVEHIYANHVIEHISYHHLDGMLGHWNEVLIPGGTLHVACPNIDTEIRDYLRTGNYFKLQQALWGGQKDGPLDFHVNGFTPTILRQKLESAGFEIISLEPNSIKGLEVVAKKRVLDEGTI